MQQHEVVIIGGGPAGLTAGIYTARYGLDTLLLERGLYGGQIVNARLVDNYPGFPDGISGMDLGQLIYNQAAKFAVKMETVEVTGFSTSDSGFIIKTEDEEISSRSVIIATGSNYQKLNIDGENKLSGRGVSYCATCDGFLFRGKTVAVIGGGDTAATDALELSEHASTVYLIHRRNQLRAAEINQRHVFAQPKIHMVWDSVVEKIEGQDKVTNLRVKNVKSGESSSLEVDGVFVAIGLLPNNGLIKGIVEIDTAGNIVTDDMMRTSKPGIFAAGDIRRNSPRQVSAAVGDGAAAAKAVFSYLREQA
ncbi:MAG: thioredoxin-disulfide reductase [Dehalococcoidia bacterium]|nr:thioredoxin-disulfide reductase [Dehalococcoidia bacterium]MDD5494754.1 thioredoxin-disulfide reductase [Dehalococcoidia bacterium]